MDTVSDLIAPAFFAFGLVVLFATYLKLEKWRIDRNIGHAQRNQLTYYGEALPPYFPSVFLDYLPANLDVRDCMAGMRHGEYAVTFEFIRGWGRGKRWLSVVALRQAHPRPLRRDLGWGYGVARSDDWIMVYGKTSFTGAIAIGGIEELWSEMRSTALGEVVAHPSPTSTGEVVIRPRYEVPKH